jgi:hypothetical protein
MTRSLLDEQAFGKSSQFRTVWSSMETLLLSYDETPYVSDAYRVALEGVGARGQMLADRDMPTELPKWLETLEQDSVRALSVTLVTDLLRIEDRLEYAEALVQDVLGPGRGSPAGRGLRACAGGAAGIAREHLDRCRARGGTRRADHVRRVDGLARSGGAAGRFRRADARIVCRVL